MHLYTRTYIYLHAQGFCSFEFERRASASLTATKPYLQIDTYGIHDADLLSFAWEGKVKTRTHTHTHTIIIEISLCKGGR